MALFSFLHRLRDWTFLQLSGRQELPHDARNMRPSKTSSTRHGVSIPYFIRVFVMLFLLHILNDHFVSILHIVISRSSAGRWPVARNLTVEANRSVEQKRSVTPISLPTNETTYPSQPPQQKGLAFVTLIYADWGNRRSFEQNIAHNCRVIRDTPGGHTLHVYTDLPYEPYCNECTCVRFRRRNCVCPAGSCTDTNSFCEKVHFMVERIAERSEFVFLDRDFIILNESFIDRLYPRTRAHDMLISYDHTHYRNWNWRKQINSGMFFLRRLPGINYTELETDYYKLGDNDDQPAVGRLMFDKYSNYDFLSYQFHCRFITDIIRFPPKLCLAMHDRANEIELLQRMDYQMKMLNGTRYRKYLGAGHLNVLPYVVPPFYRETPPRMLA